MCIRDRERAVLIPVELVIALKWALITFPIFFLLGGLGGPSGFWENAFDFGLFAVLLLFGALISGAVLTPLLLPWIPGRAFSLKGLWMGLITTLLFMAFREININALPWRLEFMGWLFLVPALAAYLAMNFTGSSSFTSLSGVKKEMRWAVPLEIGAGIIGFCLWLSSRIIA